MKSRGGGRTAAFCRSRSRAEFPSHGRGPRFDPLCVHQKSPDLLGFFSHPEKSIGSIAQNVTQTRTSDPWKIRGICSPCSPCSANVKDINFSKPLHDSETTRWCVLASFRPSPSPQY